MIEQVLASFGGIERIVGIGIAAQGFFLEKGRRIVSIGNPIAWSEIDLKTHFERQFGLPVTIQNDAKAIAVATIREGIARRHSHYVCLYLAGGIGGALVHNGQLYEGLSANAGEVGSFVARNEHRPTVRNFLEAANLTSVDDWHDDRMLDEKVRAWCAAAGSSLSLAVQMCVRIFDVPTILVCSPLPLPALTAICEAIRADPIGSNILPEVDARRLLKWPSIIPTNDSSLNRGACALASLHFLRFASQESAHYDQVLPENP